MDKNKTGKNPSPDRDDMVLKAQLNASFDKDDLTISEDLIQRTLLKIKEAEATTNADEISANDKAADTPAEDKNRRSVIKFPVRRFAGAAAAILLLVSAAWVYQNNITGTKQDNAGQAEEQFGIAGVESAENSTMSAAEGEVNQDLDNSKMAGIAKEGPLDDKESADGPATEDVADTASTADTESSMLTLVAPEVLSELYPINAEEVITFKVLKAEEDHKNLAEKSLKEPTVKAAELYELLTAYTVQVIEADAPGDILYSYEITTKDKNAITYEFYQEVVKVTDGRLPGKVATYMINEQTDLLKKLAEFTTEK